MTRATSFFLGAARISHNPRDGHELRLAGEAGDLAKRFAEGAYRHNVDALRGDLVKLLRPLMRAANAEAVSLEEAYEREVNGTKFVFQKMGTTSKDQALRGCRSTSI